VSGWLHTTPTLLKGTEHSVPIAEGAGRDAELVWTFHRTGESLVTARSFTLDHPACSFVTVSLCCCIHLLPAQTLFISSRSHHQLARKRADYVEVHGKGNGLTSGRMGDQTGVSLF